MDSLIQVGPRRWKVELNARLDGVLMLSSVNLPGGIQVIFFNHRLYLFMLIFFYLIREGNWKRTNFKCVTFLKRGTFLLQKFSHFSLMVHHRYTPVPSNLARFASEFLLSVQRAD